MTFGPDASPVEQPFNYRLDLYWFGFSAYKFFVVFSAIILLFSVWLVMAKTKFGLILRATQLDSETAQAFGIPISTVYSLVCFVVYIWPVFPIYHFLFLCYLFWCFF